MLPSGLRTPPPREKGKFTHGVVITLQSPLEQLYPHPCSGRVLDFVCPGSSCDCRSDVSNETRQSLGFRERWKVCDLERRACAPLREASLLWLPLLSPPPRLPVDLCSAAENSEVKVLRTEPQGRAGARFSSLEFWKETNLGKIIIIINSG